MPIRHKIGAAAVFASLAFAPGIRAADQVASCDRPNVTLTRTNDRPLSFGWIGAADIDIEQVTVDVREGRFFRGRIGTPKDASVWSPTPRKPFLGASSGFLAIKDPSQWGDPSVLTPGEVY